MGRKAKLNWELYKDQLLELKYVEKKSLTDINKILFEKFGFCFTNARLSQVFTQWAKDAPIKRGVEAEEQVANAN